MKNIHFVGIGGTGMSGLANICLEKGYNVTGSDLKLTNTIKYLKKNGAKIFIGHKSKNILKKIDIIVYSTAIKKENPEIEIAKNLNINIWHRSKLLSFLSKEKKNYTIAGAHGKTTTTAMLAEIFFNANKFPTVSAGGKLLFYGANGFYSKKSKIMISELDESDGSFLNMNSNSSIITNIDDDHLNYYSTKEKIAKAFEKFISNVKESIIINGEDKILNKIKKKIKNKKFTTFGFKNCDYVIKNISVENYKNSGKVFFKKKYIGTIVLSLPGKHNLLNALGALAFAREKKIPDDIIFKTFNTFKGVGRRFELIGQKNGITIIDDYAHHPREIEALLIGAKSFGYKRVICIFQPHRFTRTQQLFKEFVKVLKKGDTNIVSPIYSAGEINTNKINSKMLVNDIGKNTLFFPDFESIINHVVKIAKEEDLIMTVGAGNISDIGSKILKKL